MDDSLSPDLEKLIRCPESGQKLRFANSVEIAELGIDLEEGGWITEDQDRIYPIRDGFPILIPSECFPVDTRGQEQSE